MPALLRRALRTLPPLALAAGLAACTAGPDFHAPAAPAQQGYAAPGEADPAALAVGAKIDADWWRLYRSDALDRVLKTALAGNRSLAAARASLRRADSLAAAAAGAELPRIDATAGAEREKLNMAAYGLSGANPVFNLYQVGPTVSYDLDLSGRNRRAAEEARAQADEQGYQLRAAYLSLTGNVVLRAVEIAGLQAQITTVEGIVADDERNLALARAAKAAGSVGRGDVLHAASQLAGDRTLLPPLHQRLAVARHALALLAGHSPAEWRAPAFALDALALPADLPLSLPSALVRQRPDILAAEARLHAASAAIGVARAERYPDITLSGSLLLQSVKPDQLFRMASGAGDIGGGLLAPLFHGGILAANEQAARAAFEASRADYEQTVLAAFTQVADILQALNHDAEESADQAVAVAAADASLKVARLSYSAGNAGILQVLDAERQDQQARLGAVRARAARLSDSAQLFLAMGGGWTAPSQAPAS